MPDPRFDPARIDRILELVRMYWTKYPSLRLAQIVGNMYGGVGDPYYMSDSDFELKLSLALATNEPNEVPAPTEPVDLASFFYEPDPKISAMLASARSGFLDKNKHPECHSTPDAGKKASAEPVWEDGVWTCPPGYGHPKCHGCGHNYFSMKPMLLGPKGEHANGGQCTWCDEENLQ